MKRERLNLTFAPDVKEYLAKESEAFGMSISAFITMCIQNYRMNNQALNEMTKLQGYFDQMKELQGFQIPSEIKASDDNVVSIAQK